MMLFAPHAIRAEAWPRAAARAIARRVLRRYGEVSPYTPLSTGELLEFEVKQIYSIAVEESRPWSAPFQEYISSCQSHNYDCPCNKSYKSPRRTNRTHRKRRRASRKVLYETYHAIDPIVRKTHLSVRFCKSHGISYKDVARPHLEKDLQTNMREMCARLLMLLKRRDPLEYQRKYADYRIPVGRALKSFARCLSRKIRRTVLPTIGQWAPGNWQPLSRKDPRPEFKYSDDSDVSHYSSTEEDIFRTPRSHVFVSRTHNANLYMSESDSDY